MRTTRKRAPEKRRRSVPLNNPVRQANCEHSLSRELNRGGKPVPGDRGACEPETKVQGSE